MPENTSLIMLFRLMSGEEITVLCEDFGGERQALEAIAHALDEQRSLVLTRAKVDPDADEHGVVFNLANVVSVRVSTTEGTAAGQYL